MNWPLAGNVHTMLGIRLVLEDMVWTVATGSPRGKTSLPMMKVPWEFYVLLPVPFFRWETTSW